MGQHARSWSLSPDVKHNLSATSNGQRDCGIWTQDKESDSDGSPFTPWINGQQLRDDECWASEKEESEYPGAPEEKGAKEAANDEEKARAEGTAERGDEEGTREEGKVDPWESGYPNSTQAKDGTHSRGPTLIVDEDSTAAPAECVVESNASGIESLAPGFVKAASLMATAPASQPRAANVQLQEQQLPPTNLAADPPKPSLQLDDWVKDTRVAEQYKSMGMRHLHAWQADCLSEP